MRQFGGDHLPQLLLVHADGVEQRANDPLLLVDKRREQVKRLDLRVTRVGRNFLRPLDGFLCFLGEFIETKGHC
jgi:hypothetical protein